MSRMLEEIRRQPDTLERTLAAGLRRMARLERTLERRRPRLIVVAARGTSDNAALFGRYLLEATTGIPVSLAAPSIFTLYRSRMDLTDALVVGISQSGESTDTNLVLERARAQGALTVGITNEARSAMAAIAEFPLLVHAGKERSVAATKTYTGQLMVLYLLARALGAKIALDALRRLPEWVGAALRLEPAVSALAERYRFMDHAVVVGRGLNYANAFELSLKLKETCYVVAEGFSTADFLHGPIAMIERAFPVFAFAPPGPTWRSMREILVRLRRLKAETLLVTDRSNRGALKGCWPAVCLPAKLAVSGPGPVELYTPIPYIVPAQLLAAHLADLKGLDPDRPRTLTKVTRTM